MILQDTAIDTSELVIEYILVAEQEDEGVIGNNQDIRNITFQASVKDSWNMAREVDTKHDDSAWGKSQMP